MQERTVKFHLDGGGVHGDLIVSGFASDRTALEISAEFAEVLRKRWPGAHVSALLEEPELSP